MRLFQRLEAPIAAAHEEGDQGLEFVSLPEFGPDRVAAQTLEGADPSIAVEKHIGARGGSPDRFGHHDHRGELTEALEGLHERAHGCPVGNEGVGIAQVLVRKLEFG